MEPQRFRDQVVVVTGAASGIGRATALAFAREGARLHLCDIQGQPLRALAVDIAKRGGRASPHLCDCTDGPAMQALAQRVLAVDSRVDVLHSNAGVQSAGAFEQIPAAEWERVLRVNFWGVLNGCRAFVPAMIERRRGHLVNTASMAGLVGLPYVSPYAASKHAVVGLSAALAAELAVHNIAVTCVCPGATRTQIMRSGPLDLPGDSGPFLRDALERWAPRPEGVAEQILDAVWKRAPLCATGFDMLPLWWLQRLAPGLYLRLWRLLTPAIVHLSGRPAELGRSRPAA